MEVILYTVALIYQSKVETSTDSRAEIILRQVSRVIHETFVSRQPQRKNDQALINVMAENNCHLNITPLNILSLEALPLDYDMAMRKTSKKRNFSDLEIETITLHVTYN